MGKLLNALRGKKEAVQEVQKQEITTGKYTRTWATRIAIHQGFELNSNEDSVNRALDTLRSKQMICPCATMRVHGICKCGLFKNIEERKIKSSTSAKIKVKED